MSNQFRTTFQPFNDRNKMVMMNTFKLSINYIFSANSLPTAQINFLVAKKRSYKTALKSLCKKTYSTYNLLFSTNDIFLTNYISFSSWHCSDNKTAIFQVIFIIYHYQLTIYCYSSKLTKFVECMAQYSCQSISIIPEHYQAMTSTPLAKQSQ